MNAPKSWIRLPALLALALGLAGCGGSGNGKQDGGDGGGGACGTLQCSGSELCIHDAVCISKTETDAEGCIETQPSIFQCQGPADLSCHNSVPCSSAADCPTDASGSQLACHLGFCGIAAPAGTGLPQRVTFTGCVDAFGINQNTTGMHLAIYKGAEDPTGNPDFDVPVTEDRVNCSSWGTFSVADNVPTNIPLIVKTYDTQGKFVTTYKYNVILWADLASDDGSGKFIFDARSSHNDPRTGQQIELTPWRGYAISSTTYNLILLAMGLSSLPAGHGAVAGTVRDCAYHEVKNVRCGTAARPGYLTYFNNVEDPRPDKSQKATNVNGLYAAIDLPAGNHKLSCVAQQNGLEVPLGEYSIGVFDGGVTIVSFDWYPGL